MAAKPKKATPKKRTSAKKTSVKRKAGKKTTKISNFKKSVFIVFGVFLMISFVTFGYFLGEDFTINNQSGVLRLDKSKDRYSTEQLLYDLSRIKTKKPEEKETVISKRIVKNESKSPMKPLKQTMDEDLKIEKNLMKNQNVKLSYRAKRAKLVIIIDDVHTRAQLNDIKALGMKITPSIFPPYKLAPKSYLLARALKHYMIHLPMESSSRKFNQQYKTIKTSFTKNQIEARIKEIRALFPTAKYINNHTGSIFTGNYKAMHLLYGILRERGFLFIDSRTSGSTKVRKIAHEFGDAYVARDIFIDNTHTIPYIRKQLQKAVRIAKKKGYAIAIGHPHSVTMKALASAKDIFKDIELVYIEGIYKK